MNIEAFAPALLDWHARSGRKDLPWQRERTPYRVWVSEVMLQQTQVATVLGYYERFVARFPDVRLLAAATLDEVLHLWSGLGYYARGRHLHRAAQLVVERHGGTFPTTPGDLTALPGIGRSTAAAILALSRDERHAILDGNVKRVLARYFAVEGFPGATSVENRLWSLAEACTPATQVAAYTQGIMDLGATLCTRARPACPSCPVQAGCLARATGRQHEFPAPRPRRMRPRREAWLVLARQGERLLLEKRAPAGVWGGLWALPEFPSCAEALSWCRERLVEPSVPHAGEPLEHAFTHFDYRMHPLHVECAGRASALRDDPRFRWYDAAAPAAVGVPAPVATLLRRTVAAGPA